METVPCTFHLKNSSSYAVFLGTDVLTLAEVQIQCSQELVWCDIVVTMFAARLYLPTFKTLDSRQTTSHHDTMIAFNIVVVFMDFPSANGTYLPHLQCLSVFAIYVSSLSHPTSLIWAMPECPEVFLVFVESFGWGSSVRSGALDLFFPSQKSVKKKHSQDFMAL